VEKVFGEPKWVMPQSLSLCVAGAVGFSWQVQYRRAELALTVVRGWTCARQSALPRQTVRLKRPKCCEKWKASKGTLSGSADF